MEKGKSITFGKWLLNQVTDPVLYKRYESFLREIGELDLKPKDIKPSDLENAINKSKNARKIIRGYKEINSCGLFNNKEKEEIFRVVVNKVHTYMSQEGQEIYSSTCLVYYIPKLNLGVIKLSSNGEAKNPKNIINEYPEIFRLVPKIASKAIARYYLKEAQTFEDPKEARRFGKKIFRDYK